MTFTASERKRRLGHGAQARMVKRLGKTPGHVSRALRGERFDREVIALACQMARVPRREFFPEFSDRFDGNGRAA